MIISTFILFFFESQYVSNTVYDPRNKKGCFDELQDIHIYLQNRS